MRVAKGEGVQGVRTQCFFRSNEFFTNILSGVSESYKQTNIFQKSLKRVNHPQLYFLR